MGGILIGMGRYREIRRPCCSDGGYHKSVGDVRNQLLPVRNSHAFEHFIVLQYI